MKNTHKVLWGYGAWKVLRTERKPVGSEQKLGKSCQMRRGDRQGPYMRGSVGFGKVLAFILRAMRRHQRASAVRQ